MDKHHRFNQKRRSGRTEEGEPDLLSTRCDFCSQIFPAPRWNCRTCHRCAAAGAPDQSLMERKDYEKSVSRRREETAVRGSVPRVTLTSGDPMLDRNEEVRAFARRNRLRRVRREDGEVVLPLQGGGHAGKHGPETWYFHVERHQPCRLISAVRERVGDKAELRTGDFEVVVVAPEPVFKQLIEGEQAVFTPRRRRPAPPHGGGHLPPHHFKPRTTSRANGRPAES